MNLSIRKIKPTDNARVAEIIRTVMPEFDCVGPEYSISDPEVDDMYTAYSMERSAFYVIENQDDEMIYGVGGYGPLANGDADVCELRKMYFLPDVRGYGMGKALLQLCIDQARADNFKVMYLETVYRMVDADRLYRKFGFEDIDGPMGNTGHSACDHFMVKDL
ncbi:MAG: GNAT family N-acetyltransferase [Bacteroidota bacterium]